MKDGIHPDYHPITVVMTDGSELTMRSTYGQPNARLTLDIDPRIHPAWTGGTQQLTGRGGSMARFSKRFQGFGFKQ